MEEPIAKQFALASTSDYTIMLGTNDLKARFDRSADDIALAFIAWATGNPAVGQGMGSRQPADITLICPLYSQAGK